MKSVTIRSVRVIDGTGQTTERATVIIRGSTIAAIGPDRDLPPHVEHARSMAEG